MAVEITQKQTQKWFVNSSLLAGSAIFFLGVALELAISGPRDLWHFLLGLCFIGFSALHGGLALRVFGKALVAEIGKRPT